MGPPDRAPDPLTTDQAAYRSRGAALERSILDSLPGWIRHQVSLRVDDPDRGRQEAAIDAVMADVTARLDRLVAAPVTDPHSGPLECIRQSLGPVTALLRELGVEPPDRDPFDERARPADRYALGPMSFAELSPAVHEAGIAWGAAKAYLHRSTRRTLEPDRLDP